MMTWAEFKEAVAALGVKDDEQMWFIDWAPITKPRIFHEEERDRGMGVAIT